MAKTIKAIFGNTDFLTAQAFVFEQTKVFGDKKVETVFGGIIEATGEDVFTKVRIAGLDCENIFFDTEEKTSERLGKALEFIKNELKQTESYNILLFVWHESVLHLLTSRSDTLGFSPNRALLFRDGQTVNLTDEVIPEQLISGHIQPQDKLLLVSGRMVEDGILDWDKQFIAMISKSSEDTLEEDINLSLNASGKTEPVAVILISSDEIPLNLDSSASVENNNYDNISGAKLFSRLKQAFSIIVLGLKSKKLLFVGGVTLLFVVFFSWQVWVILQKKDKDNQKYSNLLIQAKTNIESAKLSDDFEKVGILITQIEKLKPNSPDIKTLKKELEVNKSKVLKIEMSADFKEFLSLDLIKKDFSPKKMSYSLGKVLFLDESSKTLISLDLKNKTNQILAGRTQLGDAKFASLNGDRAFIYSSDKGILRVDLEAQDIVTVSKIDSEWGKVVNIFGFSSNIYLLDTLKNQIWKYVPIASGYAEKASYLKYQPAGRQGSKVDLAGGSMLQIDYSVWVLKLGGEILKFTGGNPDFFSIGGLDKPIEEVKSFFVAEEEDNLYILDSINSRIIVLKKNGQYQKQIQGDKFKTASDFVVDEENKIIYLLENNKIFQIELK